MRDLKCLPGALTHLTATAQAGGVGGRGRREGIMVVQLFCPALVDDGVTSGVVIIQPPTSIADHHTTTLIFLHLE